MVRMGGAKHRPFLPFSITDRVEIA